MIAVDEQTEAVLREVFGQDLDRITREVLIAEAYRAGGISIGQAARLLDLSINDAYGFMKNHGIPVNYTPSDFEADRESLRELRNQIR